MRDRVCHGDAAHDWQAGGGVLRSEGGEEGESDDEGSGHEVMFVGCTITFGIPRGRLRGKQKAFSPPARVARRPSISSQLPAKSLIRTLRK